MLNKKRVSKIKWSLIIIWLLSILACYPVFDDHNHYRFKYLCDDFLTYFLPYAFLTLIIYILLAAIVIAALGRDRCMDAIVKYFTIK